MEMIVDSLRRLLESYTEPCVGDCDHSQCPLLRELHALRIKATLERARLTVKPVVDREKKGEEIGDLMNMQLDATASPAAPVQQPSWIDSLVGAFDDSPLNTEILENEKRARLAIESGRCPTCNAAPAGGLVAASALDEVEAALISIAGGVSPQIAVGKAFNVINSVRARLNTITAAPKEEAVHHDPRWLWCGRCQAWIETEHLCGAQYIDRGSHYELIRPAVTRDEIAATTPSPDLIFKNTKEAMLYAQQHGIPAVIPVGVPSQHIKEAAREIAERWLKCDLPERAKIQSLALLQLETLAEDVLQRHCFSAETN